MSPKKTIKEEITIKFAGDSGDGMQLTGNLFTGDTALTGNDLATFPDFPAEIRAPIGTLAGVSGFQLHFGSKPIYTPGDEVDVLVAMNAAALKSNLNSIKKGATIIVNTAGFDAKNLRLAHYEADENPIEDHTLDNFEVFKIDISKLTNEALKDTDLSKKEKDRSKNMFVLGFLLWRYSRNLDFIIDYLDRKFARKPDILESNKQVLKAGYHYGDTTETFTTRYEVKPANLEKGTYRNIMGNPATVYGLIAASQKAGIPLFYGSYPITPASDILHLLAAQKHFGVKTFQAEDEIAAICSAIGASYGGNLAVTGTSGPGLALKSEAMGLAVMLELPLVILNIQRGGPSTGMPTKTEQADLLMALYGRNGECPLPVLAASSPADAFETAFEAARIALQHMTPVLFLSDGYIANGAEPWKFPTSKDLPEIPIHFAEKQGNEPYLPYLRDKNLVRQWAIPGTPELAHRIGGLEKENETGNVSYDPKNHELMVRTREAKIEKIAEHLPPQKLVCGPEKGDLLILGWGSTYGVIESVTRECLSEGYRIAHAHLRHLKPFPANLEKMLKNYKHVLIPEINTGQLSRVIRDHFLIPVKQFNKIQGIPITHRELKEHILSQILTP